MNKKNIYICNSYNDIQYILSHLVKSYRSSVIVVFNHKGIFDYFSTINHDNFELFFFENRLLNVTKLKFWINEIKEIFKIWRFSKMYNYSSVYTINLYFDLQSLMLLNFLNKANKIFVFRSPELLYNFHPCKNDFKTLFWSIIYFTKFQKYKTYQTFTLGLSNDWIIKNTIDYNLIDNPLVDKNINCFRLKPPTKSPFLLLVFSSEEEKMFGYKNFINLIETLLSQFKNFEFVVKGHPRIGSPLAFESFNFKTINKNLPLELVDLSNCKMVFGLGSVALSNIATTEIEVYSLIHLLPSSLSKYKLDTFDYLNSQSDRVHFPVDLNKIKQL